MDEKLSIQEQIRVMAARRGMTLGQLAEASGQSRQNLAVALKRDDYTTNYLKRIAEALECDLVVSFEPRSPKIADLSQEK